MAMLMHQWSHLFVKVWIYAGLVLTAYFLVRAFLEWKAGVDADTLDGGQPARAGSEQRRAAISAAESRLPREEERSPSS
jgi:hypothetical protein